MALGLQKASVELMSSLDSVADSNENVLVGIRDLVELRQTYSLKLSQAAMYILCF